MRCFLAIPLPDDISLPVNRILDRLGPLVDFRPVPKANYHLTLDFYGSLDQNQLKELESALRRVFNQASPFEIKISGLTVLPNFDHPHVLVLEAGAAPALINLQQTVVEAANLPIRRNTEPNRFRPHIALGRWTRPPHSRHELKSKISHPKFKLNWSMPVKSAALFESHLSADGARYRLIEIFNFAL